MAYPPPTSFVQRTDFCYGDLLLAFYKDSIYLFPSLLFSDSHSIEVSLLSYTGRTEYGTGKKGRLGEAIELPLST